MSGLSPLLRISGGLVLLTCAILIALDLVGVLPAPADERVEARVQLCETLAAQAAVAAERDDLGAVRAALRVVVKRNDDVLSAGLRGANGRLLVASGEHARLWPRDEAERSRATHVAVPLFRSGEPWGTVEVLFADLYRGGVLEQVWSRPLLRVVLIMAGLCFVAYLVYMRYTLRQLDPTAVIPQRVQAALDVMAEGILLLDEGERIVLANESFARRTGKKASALLGQKASSLKWKRFGDATANPGLPWVAAIREAETFTDTLRLGVAGETRTFQVKGAPVLDGFGRAKGAIATFDDVTELERKKIELERALTDLQSSQEEILAQNEELEFLAHHDSLTGVANRRFFMQRFESDLPEKGKEGKGVACVMADIDHFKRVNDEHGHQTGDDVIRRVSEALMVEVRSRDNVCRYGGEEFCLVLQNTDAAGAMAAAERIRNKIDSPGFARVPVTVSFGVSSLAFGAQSLAELINQADEALYAAKAAGRNRVVRWDERQGEDTAEAS